MATVTKRTWEYNGTTKSAWIVRYFDRTGARRQQTFDLKRQADTFAFKMKRDMQDGLYVDRSEVKTVKEVCDLYVMNAEQRWTDGKLGQSRYTQIERVCRLHIRPVLGKMLFSDLTWNDVEDWYNHLAAKPRCSPQTRAVYVEVLVEIERFAKKRGWTVKTVVADFKIDMGGVSRKIIRTFTLEEVGQLLQAVAIRGANGRRRSHAMLKCAVHLAAFCGLRRGEIFGLTHGDVDLDRRIVRIRHSLTTWDELKGPKTQSGKRDVPMPLHVLEMLRDWLGAYYVPNDRRLIFRAADGERFWAANFMAGCWYPLLKRAGLWQEEGDQFHFHALRHFAASWMIENGLSPPDVASLLGHSKFDMTLQVYAHPVMGGNHRHDAIDRMAGRLITAT